MSIDALCGKPGAGKSYHAVMLASEAVQNGRAVITNLPLKVDHPTWKEAIETGLLFMREPTEVGMEEGNHFGCWQGWEGILDAENAYLRTITIGKGKDQRKTELGPLVIVDEAASTFQEVQSDRKRNNEWQKIVERMRVHRHSKADVQLLMQDHMQCPPAIKPLVQNWHRIFNRSEVFGSLWSRFFGKPYLVKTHAKAFGQNDTPLSVRRGRFKSDVFALYDSFALGGASGGGDIEGTSGRIKTGSMFTKWWMWALVVSLFAVPFFGFRMFGSLSGLLSGEKSVVRLGDDPLPQPTGTPSPVTPGQPVPASPGINLARPANGVLPPIGTPYVGTDGDFFYFANGFKSRWLELQAQDFVVIESNACLIEFQTAPGVTPVQSIRYTCSRGY